MKHVKITSLLALSLFAAGCMHDNNSDTTEIHDAHDDTRQYPHAETTEVVITTVAPDYSAGSVSLISATEPHVARNNLVQVGSDLAIKTYGEYFYLIERFNADSITKFHHSAPSTPIWQFSTQDPGDATSRNPHDLVFANANEAYVLRYGATSAWIVNPGVSLEGNFKVGELDLSAYADGDGIPEMDQGIIVKGKLFITLQRQDTTDAFNWVPGDAYVAVFDLASQTEIDTGKGQNGLKGILLPIQNPNKIVYSPATGLIYVQGIGSYAADSFTGGIATIDPDSYAVNLLVDDASTADGGVGKISNLAILSADKGYLVSYEGFGDNSLYSFNPSTGAIDPTPVAGQANKSIADIEIDSHGRLWLADQTNAGIVIINTHDDEIEHTLIGTDLNPDQIAFINDHS